MNLFSLLALAQCACAAVLGIDFGAEFTKSSLVAPNIPFEILLTPESKRKDASGLVFRTKGTEVERFYGSAGTQYTSRFPASSLYYLKSLVGVSFDSPAVEEYLAVHPGIELVKNKRNGVSVRIDNTDYPVEQLVAMNFKEIKARAQDELKQKLGSGYVSNVAISVPGYFDMTQRRAISDAATLSDLQLISLVNDGVAVAVNYASTRQFNDKQYVVVYDMGSESTSSTLISFQDLNSTTSITVEGYSAIPVGGKTLTTKVRDILIKEFQAKTGIQDELQPRILNRLWKEAERAKAVLSANTEVSIFIESLYKDLDLSTKISRDQLEEAVQEVKDEVITPLVDSLITFDGTTIEPSQLESIILAGGGTRVPFVQQQIRDYAGNILSKNVNADESAVLGTTLRGVGISGIFRSKPMVINDKSLHSFSLNDGSEVTPVFPRGSALDTTKSFNFPAEDITLTLNEDDERVVAWTFPLLSEMTKALETDGRKCTTDPEISVRFHLTNSEIVQLSEAQVRCKSILEESEEGEDQIPKTVSRNLNAKRQDFVVTPLTTADREELSYGIRKLDKQDSDRLRKQTLHNNLESLLYKIRELAPEESRASEMLEECEDDLTIVRLGELLKEAEVIFAKYKPVDPEQLFNADLEAALDKVGIVADFKHPQVAEKVLAKAPLEQLRKIDLVQEGELHDLFRKNLKVAIMQREAKLAQEAKEQVLKEQEEEEVEEEEEEKEEL